MAPSLSLCQALEEEYLNLHGALRHTEPVSLRGLPPKIMPRLDWNFDAGHIKKPERLRRRLRDERDPLALHLRERSERLDAALAEREDDDERIEAALIAGLDSLLRLPRLADEEACAAIAGERCADEAHCVEETRRVLSRFAVTAGETLTDDEQRHLNRLLLEAWFPGELESVDEIRLAAVRRAQHREGQAALCLSGGGIRSGTFALGLMQGFARHNQLDNFDYLSTVSGGGYIGSWLTAWLNRHPRGISGVIEELKNTTPRTSFDPEPEPLRHLRAYSNFLTPKVGLLTADTWTFIGIYLRNLALNWLALIPLLLAALALPRLAVAVLHREPVRLFGALANSFNAPQMKTTIAALLAVNNALHENMKGILLGVGFLFGVLTVLYVSINRPGASVQLQRSRFWRTRTNQRSFLIYCLLPLIASAAALTLYWAWTLRDIGSIENLTFSVFGWNLADYLPRAFVPLATFTLFGVLAHVVGWLASHVVLRRWKAAYRNEVSWQEFVMIVVTGAVGGLLAWTAASLFSQPVIADPDGSWMMELYGCLAVPALLLVFTLAGVFFIAVSSRFYWIDDEDREWWTRFGAWILIAIIVWSSFSVLVIFGPLLFFYAPKLVASLGGVSALIATLGAWSARTPATEEKPAERGRLAMLGDALLPTLALVFLIVLVILLSLATDLLLRALGAPLAAFGGSEFLVVQPLDKYVHIRIVHYATAPLILLFILACVGITLIAARLIDLNKFSLHGGYRNRLIRAYLGASQITGERKPNPFTGFDPADNIQMHELRPALFHERDFKSLKRFAIKIRDETDDTAETIRKHLSSDVRGELEGVNDREPLAKGLRRDLIEDLNRILEDDAIEFDDDEAREPPPPSPAPASLSAAPATSRALDAHNSMLRKRAHLMRHYPEELIKKYPPSHRLLHVVNLALNLVGGKNLAWQQRRAASFTVSPLHAGSYRLGYRKSRDYGGRDGISLGTAATISGAAASSNMGYYTTSPVLSFVMTFFNVRLGWWLGNPGAAGNKTYQRAHPQLSVMPVLSEAFGMTDDASPYVYLSDGGHFENLALYEMVLRRCHTIVVSDGAQDGNFQFGDLGNAVRKIRIDLGIPIEFDDFPDYTQRDENGVYWAIGRIRYSCIDAPLDGQDAPDGRLIYIKPTIYGTEPPDVQQYARAHPAFPHETTGDQFFDEPQFESYRALGSHVADRIHRKVRDETRGERTRLDIHEYFDKL